MVGIYLLSSREGSEPMTRLVTFRLVKRRRVRCVVNRRAGLRVTTAYNPVVLFYIKRFLKSSSFCAEVIRAANKRRYLPC